MDEIVPNFEDRIAAAVDSKNVEELETIFSEIRQNGEEGRSLNLLGNAFRKLNKIEQAYDAYSQGSNFGNVLGSYGAADCASKLKDEKNTLLFVERTINDPKITIRYVARCMQFAARVYRFDIADEIFARHVDSKDMHSEFYVRKAYVEQMRLNHTSARYFARKAIDMEPDNPDLKLQMAKEFMPSEDFVEFDYGGKHFLIYYHELLGEGRKEANTGFHELEMLEYIRDNLGVQKTILDIGCHIGNHSRYIKDFVPHETLIGFDAAPGTAQFYCRNVPGAILYNVPVGLEGEEVHLLGDIQNHRWGQSRIAIGEEAKREDAKPMVTRSIDSFKLQDVSLMKIDVEGWELNVLTGAQETIAKFQPDIILEVFRENIASYDEAFAKMLPNYEKVHIFQDSNMGKHDVLLSARR